MGHSRGRPLPPLSLSAEERAYLERQVRRHRAARSFRIAAVSSFVARTALRTRKSGRNLAFMSIRWANGGGGFRRTVLTAYGMSLAPAGRAPSRMTKWRR